MPDAVAVFFKAPVIRVFKPMGFEGHRRPAMQQFVNDNGFTVKTAGATTDADGNATCSHYMYGGLYAMGKLVVPQGSPTAALAAAVVTDFRMCRFGALTENKPAKKPMRFYLDVDFNVLGGLEDATWSLIEATVLEETRRFFPSVPGTDDLFVALVLASGTRSVCKPDGTTGTKAGVHVVFQNLFVDVDMALYLSSAIVARVQKLAPESDDRGLATCIDQAVYGKTRGLRWAWQFKCSACVRCCSTSPEGRVVPNRKGCTHCFSGVVADVSSSMYAPVYTVDGMGTRTYLPDCRMEPTIELLLASSIRYVEADAVSPGFVVYEGAPPRPVLRAVGKRAENSVAVVTDAGEPAKPAKADLVLRGSEAAKALQAAIRRMHRMYADIDVKYAHRAGNGNWYKVFVRNVGASYCMNVGKDHSHAQILFIAKRSGIQQVCQCRCDTTEGRITGRRCRDYSSPSQALLAAERSVLFLDADAAEGSWTFKKPSASVAATIASVVSSAVAPASAACFTFEERLCRMQESKALQVSATRGNTYKLAPKKVDFKKNYCFRPG